MNFSVLIIDDTQLVVERMLGILSASPYVSSIEVAGTVAKGLELASLNDHGLIFLDQRLPDGKGSELLKILRKNNFKGKIIMFSAFDNDFHRDSYLQQGADFALDKNDDLHHINAVLMETFSKN